MTLKDIIEIEDEVDKINDALQIIDAFIPVEAEDLTLAIGKVSSAMYMFCVRIKAEKDGLKKGRK
jgi:hypothetical protein